MLPTGERIPARLPNFSLERLDNETLLYYPGLTKVIQLNETASLVWELCDGRRSISEIATLLADTFPESGAQVVQDVDELLEHLALEGAIQFTTGG